MNRRHTATRRSLVVACIAAALGMPVRRAAADGTGPAISRGEWGRPEPGRPVTLFVGRVERLIRLYFIPTSDPESFLMSHVFRVRVERVLAGDVPPVVDILVHENSETTSVSIPNRAIQAGKRYLFMPSAEESGDPIVRDAAFVVSAGYATALLTRRTESVRLAEAEAYIAAAQGRRRATPVPNQ